MSEKFERRTEDKFFSSFADLQGVVAENDCFGGTPEERYVYMLAWLKKKAEEQDG